MAQTVNVPGVGQLSFPDGMSDDDMAKAIQANYPQLHGTQAQSPSGTDTSQQTGGGKAGNSFDMVNGKAVPTGSADAQAAQDPTAGMSVADKIVTGMGQAYSQIGTGIAQRYKQITGDKEGYQLSQAQVAQQRELDKQLENSNAAKAGNLLGQMTMMVAMPGGGFAAAAAAGAASGLATPTATGESATQNAAMGAALGAIGAGAGKLLGKVVGGVVQLPGKTEMSEAAQEGIDVLTKNGVQLNAAQQGGGKFARTLTNVVSDSAWTGSTLARDQKVQFTSAVMSQLGVSSMDASPVAMAQAKTAISARFDQMAQKYPIPMDDPFLTKLATITSAADSELDAGQMDIVNKQVDNLLKHAADGNGTMTGGAFTNARSSLSRLQAQKNVTGHWAGEIHDALTEALQRNASPQDAQAIVQMRTQWKGLRQVEDAIGPDNLIAPAALYGVLDRAAGRNSMVYGAGDQSLVQLAQAGKNVLGGGTANSGTAQRVAGMLALGSTLGAVDELVHGDPSEALKVGALGVAGPALAKIVVENPASARLIGQWARSKAVANFRDSLAKQGSKLLGMAGAGSVAAGGGTGQSTMGPDYQPYNGVDTSQDGGGSEQ